MLFSLSALDYLDWRALSMTVVLTGFLWGAILAVGVRSGSVPVAIARFGYRPVLTVQGLLHPAA